MVHPRKDTPGKEKDTGGGIRSLLPFIAVLAVAAVSNYPLVRGQFTGEDESLQLWHTTQVLDGLRHARFRSVVGVFLGVQHPPMRYILSVPGLLLFPDTEFGARFGAIVLSLLMTWQVVKLGEEVGGKPTGITAGLLLAVSGVYTWTSMAFGWSLIAVMMIVSVRLLRKGPLDVSKKEGRRILRCVSAFTFVAFLVNTSCLLFFFSTLGVFGLLNRRRIKAFAWTTSPFFILYVAYYVFFLVIVPWYFERTAGNAMLAGQYAHHIGRAHTHPNLQSLVANLKGLNAYVFPFVSWLILAAAAVHLFRKDLWIFLWLAPFALAWSFLLEENTQSYFLLVFITVLPFGVHSLIEKVGKKPALGFFCALIVGAAAWNYFLFCTEYSEIEYPSGVLRASYAQADRRHNVVKPYREIGRDLDAILASGQAFTHNIGGCFTTFYYKDDPSRLHHSRFAGVLGTRLFPTDYNSESSCYRPRFGSSPRLGAVVTDDILCPDRAQVVRTYPGSPIRMYALK